MRYDKTGEQHYLLASALQKSIRGSDDNAALYYLGRMLKAKPSLKIRTANAIFWVSFGIFKDYSQKKYIF